MAKRIASLQAALIFVIAVLTLPPARPAMAQGALGQGESNKFSQPQLDQLLAPVALYPDSVLAQILMASTYPLEVVQPTAGQRRTRT